MSVYIANTTIVSDIFHAIHNPTRVIVFSESGSTAGIIRKACEKNPGIRQMVIVVKHTVHEVPSTITEIIAFSETAVSEEVRARVNFILVPREELTLFGEFKFRQGIDGAHFGTTSKSIYHVRHEYGGTMMTDNINDLAFANRIIHMHVLTSRGVVPDFTRLQNFVSTLMIRDYHEDIINLSEINAKTLDVSGFTTVNVTGNTFVENINGCAFSYSAGPEMMRLIGTNHFVKKLYFASYTGSVDVQSDLPEVLTNTRLQVKFRSDLPLTRKYPELAGKLVSIEGCGKCGLLPALYQNLLIPNELCARHACDDPAALDEIIHFLAAQRESDDEEEEESESANESEDEASEEDESENADENESSEDVDPQSTDDDASSDGSARRKAILSLSQFE